LRLAAVSAALAVTAACTEPALTAPTPSAVDPSFAPNDVRVELEILGDFEPRVRTDFGGTAGGELDSRFEAWLAPEPAGERHALEEVALVARGRLRAFVPAGTPEGTYGVVVSAPNGLKGALGTAYTALPPEHAVLHLTLAPLEAQRVGVPFTVAATAVDWLGRPVASFESPALLSDGTGTLAIAPGARFVRGRLTTLVEIAAPSPHDSITLRDASGLVETSVPFVVARGLPSVLEVVHAQAAELIAGTCSPAFEVRLEDAAGRVAEVPPGAVVELRSGPEGTVLFADDEACAHPVSAVPLSPVDGTATFRLRAVQAGPVVVRLDTKLVPSARLDLTVAPASAVRLGFLTPSPVVIAGSCSQAVEVASLGPDGSPASISAETEIRLTVPAELALFEDPSCLVPLGTTSLGPDNNRFDFFLQAQAVGRYILAAEASGLSAAAESVLVVP
jgi:hypothetical protein